MKELDEILGWYESNYPVPIAAKERVIKVRTEVERLREALREAGKLAEAASPHNNQDLRLLRNFIILLAARAA